MKKYLSATFRNKYAYNAAFAGLLFLMIPAQTLTAQEADLPGTVEIQGVPSFYIDCNRCDYNHIRREIPYVNYVRDPQQADIHLFITDQQTGDGGREYEFSFIGREQFSGINYSFKHLINRNSTWAETRDELNRVIQKGALPFVMQTPLASRFAVDYVHDGETEPASLREEDPWKYWVFEIYAGSISLEMESNQTEFDSRGGFYADKVTEDWKMRFRPYFNYTFDEIRRTDEDPVTSTIHRYGLDTYAIRSIGGHWSAGLFGSYISRNDQNIRHEVQVHPGIEYSIYPYEVATRKEITFVYQAGYTFADYYEETIFEQTREHLLSHELSASVGVEQPWGSINGGLTGSHYLHDLEKRSAEFFGRISVRLLEGLSLNFSASFEMIHDQLSLPAGDASLEDVLLRQRQLATEYDLNGSISLSYTFGSDFANIVNTRF
ncbi:MAG: hypothetical protein WD604_07835 [Balneolaceae bacterium]